MFAHKTSFVLLAALIAQGCTGPDRDPMRGDGRIQGRVTDQTGSQEARLAGSGTIEAASAVNAYTAGQDGELTLLAEAEVEADGSYTVDIDPAETRVVLQAVSDEGRVLASALLASAEAPFATPMDVESSVEAEVYLSMLASGTSVAEVDIIDIRERIDADVAAAVHASEGTSGNAQAQIDALAEAIEAAQATEVEAWANAGVTTSQSAMFQAELAAAASLDAALHQADDASRAYEAFFDELVAAAEAEGASVSEQSHAEAQASMAFRLTLEQRLSTTEQADLLAAATTGAAAHEAWVAEAATTAVLVAASATSDTLAAAESASAQLHTDISASGTVGAAAAAYADFSAALVGEGSVQGSVLGAQLGVDVASAVVVDAALATCETAAVTLDTTVSADVAAAVEIGEPVDAEAVALAVTDAWATYVSAVEGALATAVATTDQEVAVELTLIATGSFRGE